ncbi:MAG TPA: hypothetical protein VEK08_17590 [Planctomycetota bacterium]|nr:hypothetical protein [Planctomycetota bacterium]
MWVIILFSAFYLAVLVFAARHYWRAYKQNCPGRTFNYHITDIWAAMLALTPTLLLIKEVLAANPMMFWEENLFLGALIGAGQIAGLFVGRIHIELPPYNGAISAWDSAISILTGALLGAVAPFACIVAAAILIAFWPLTLVLTGIILVNYVMNRASAKRLN